eukprot:scaffold271098_cov27-Tisochrysis_lutea.AAC.1
MTPKLLAPSRRAAPASSRGEPIRGRRSPLELPEPMWRENVWLCPGTRRSRNCSLCRMRSCMRQSRVRSICAK